MTDMMEKKTYTDKESQRLRFCTELTMKRCTKYVIEHIQSLSGAEIVSALEAVKEAEQRIYEEIGFKDPFLIKSLRQ